ncbi:MAG: hypothetical protein ABSB84_05810 [Verrucomicrobiota bacterium]|jgi:hypothetical protein
MLIRISLIVAIVAALAVGALSFTQVRGKINTLITQRNDEHEHRVTAETDLAKTKKTLATTQTTLKQAQQDLADAQAAKKKAEETSVAQTKRADELSEKLTKAAADRDEAQGKLGAYELIGLTPKQVTELGRTLKNAQNTIEAINAEKLVMSRTIDRLNTEIEKIMGTQEPVITLRADLKGKILVVDPKWDFVVLDIGIDQGVKEDGELLVSRDGKLVAKVIVRSVEGNRSIANIVPGWKLGQVIEGDDVSPAHPAS